MTFAEALAQNPAFPCPEEVLKTQALIDVRFWTLEGKEGMGQIVIAKELAHDVLQLFDLIYARKFPIASAIPVADPVFHWDDDLSMSANNTSGFNYRNITGTTRLSNHALGRALDINPLQNPYVTAGGVRPPKATYDILKPGTIASDSFIVEFLKERGWRWGGDWRDQKDYQHFDK